MGGREARPEPHSGRLGNLKVGLRKRVFQDSEEANAESRRAAGKAGIIEASQKGFLVEGVCGGVAAVWSLRNPQGPAC